MARPLRLEHPGAAWHITVRGNERRNIVRSDRDRRRFVELLGEAARRYGWVITAWVLMSNHYHLVIETPDSTLSRGMQWLNSKYAQWFNKTHKRVGHLFQGRFKAVLVDRDTYLLELLRYVVLNPVRAKMVARPEDYRWSSYRATAGLDEAPPWLAVDRVLAQFAPDRELAQGYYRDFVLQAIGTPDSPWDKLTNQIYLGSEAWTARMRTLVETRPRPDDHPSTQLNVGRPSMPQIVETVAKVFATTADAIRLGHGGDERMAVAWLGCFEGRHRRRAIAASLLLRSSGRVSDLISTCDAELDRRPLLRPAIDRCCDLLRGSPDTSPHLPTNHRLIIPAVAQF